MSPHRLDDGVAIDSGREAGPEGYYQRGLVDPGVEPLFGDPRIHQDRYAGNVRQVGTDHHGDHPGGCQGDGVGRVSGQLGSEILDLRGPFGYRPGYRYGSADGRGSGQFEDHHREPGPVQTGYHPRRQVAPTPHDHQML